METASLNHSLQGEVSVYQGQTTRTAVAAPQIELIAVVNRIVLCTVVGTFGIGANVINICVFVRQGLDTPINISFSAMAVSDLVRIVTVHWMNVCTVMDLLAVQAPFDFDDVIYLTAGWPVGCANRVTLFVTVYITVERCFCITDPFKVKKIITPMKTSVVIVTIVVFNILPVVPEYTSVYFDYRYFPAKNMTLLGLAFRGNRGATLGVSFTAHSILMTSALVTVVALSAVLVIELRVKTKWREDNAACGGNAKALSRRERKTGKMVLLVAVSAVIFYTPGVMLSVTTVMLPEFSVSGKLSGLFRFLFPFVFVLFIVNASANVLIYYSMSSRYRDNFRGLVQGRAINKPMNKEQRR